MHSSTPHIRVQHDADLEREADAAARAVGRAYEGVLHVDRLERRDPPASAWEPTRGQLRADLLLEGIGDRPALWLLEEDAYTPGLSFVFGLARRGQGAIVSVARLGEDAMIAKESVHEVGHFLGLPHCANACVMRFSNTLEDARAKPHTLCTTCDARLAVGRAP